LKYVSKFGPAICVVYATNNKLYSQKPDKPSFWFLFAAQLFTTLFCLYWDYIWDWGIFKKEKTGRKLLRDKMKFSKYFYYTCIFLNTLFRFWWLIGAAYEKPETESFFDHMNMMFFLGMMVEAIRRTLWSIIRVENEFYHNFENYRDVLVIPPIKDESD